LPLRQSPYCRDRATALANLAAGSAKIAQERCGLRVAAANAFEDDEWEDGTAEDILGSVAKDAAAMRDGADAA
jgi:hypothetical protein